MAEGWYSGGTGEGWYSGGTSCEGCEGAAELTAWDALTISSFYFAAYQQWYQPRRFPSGFPVVSQWFHSGFTVVSQWRRTDNTRSSNFSLMSHQMLRRIGSGPSRGGVAPVILIGASTAVCALYLASHHESVIVFEASPPNVAVITAGLKLNKRIARSITLVNRSVVPVAALYSRLGLDFDRVPRGRFNARCDHQRAKSRTFPDDYSNRVVMLSLVSHFQCSVCGHDLALRKKHKNDRCLAPCALGRTSTRWWSTRGARATASPWPTADSPLGTPLRKTRGSRRKRPGTTWR